MWQKGHCATSKHRSETRIHLLPGDSSLSLGLLSLWAQWPWWEEAQATWRSQISQHEAPDKWVNIEMIPPPSVRPSQLTPRGANMSCPHQALLKLQICEQDTCRCLKPVNLGVICYTAMTPEWLGHMWNLYYYRSHKNIIAMAARPHNKKENMNRIFWTGTPAVKAIKQGHGIVTRFGVGDGDQDWTSWAGDRWTRTWVMKRCWNYK